ASTLRACCRTARRPRSIAVPSSTTPMRARGRSSSACSRRATSTSGTERACAMPTRSTAVRCCRPWAPISRCSRKASRASLTARPTAPASSAPKGRARPRSTARRWSGGRTTCSWCRRGSTTRTGRARSRCCSRFPIARRRKRSASGARITARTNAVGRCPVAPGYAYCLIMPAPGPGALVSFPVVPDVGRELPLPSDLLPHHEILAGDFLRPRTFGSEAERSDLARGGLPQRFDVERCEFRIGYLLRHALPQCLDRGSAFHHGRTRWEGDRVIDVERSDAAEVAFFEEIDPFRVYRLDLRLLGDCRRA